MDRLSRVGVGLLGGLFCLLVLLPSVVFAFDVAVVVSDRGAAHQAFAEAFGIKARGLGHRVLDAGTAADGVNAAVLAGADLVVVSGEAALSAALQVHQRPTLAVMLGRERFEAIRKQHPNAAVSAFTLEQPADRQLRLLRAVLPNSRSVGLLSGTASHLGQDWLAAAKTAGLEMGMAVVASEREIVSNLEGVLRGSDVFIATPDPLLSSPTAARAILLTSYRFQKPIIAFSRAYVEAGALAGVFTTPELIAADVAAWLGTQQGGTVLLPPPAGPRSFEIAVNRQVARALGIRLADDAQLRRLTEGGV